ncbi:thiamine diphosphokinase [Paenibacillus koleovorans]|uniref:thiamine diphosphokinase n=1 Tax=Paenibacillus koleovorans TaxID=121608 RepID=UPI000FD79694|nr:thiamine diphosphokinase [Paenibacillus koleovorans]
MSKIRPRWSPDERAGGGGFGGIAGDGLLESAPRSSAVIDLSLRSRADLVEAGEPRILIFTGGTLGSWALEEVRLGDILIGADKGALFLVRHGLRPDLALGDFDSVDEGELEEIRCGSVRFEDCDPIMKDYTDTEMAFHRALEWPLPAGAVPREIVLLGALGTRFDHSLANVHLLRIGLTRGVVCRIVDAYNEVQLIDRCVELERGRYANVSLLPLTPEVRGITLRGFLYPLERATLAIGQSLGISNVLVDPIGRVELEQGQLLVIRSRD